VLVLSERLGLQTISWGTKIHNLREVAESARALGFHGLELAQPPHSLPEPAVLGEILDGANLRLLSLTGGSLQSRMAFGRALNPLYYYVDEWSEASVRSALDEEACLALHPHAYKEMDSIEVAGQYLRRFPQLRLIIDTAHAYLVGDDLQAALEIYGDRIVSVHLKDWTSQFGRSATRFARGFTALGAGEIHESIRVVLAALIEQKFGGWLVVEQDSADGDPLLAAQQSRKWLERFGV